MVIVPLSPEALAQEVITPAPQDKAPQIAETPTPARRSLAPTGPDKWAFHGLILQKRYEASRQYGEERAQRPPDTVGNIFGAQPPKDPKK